MTIFHEKRLANDPAITSYSSRTNGWDAVIMASQVIDAALAHAPGDVMIRGRTIVRAASARIIQEAQGKPEGFYGAFCALCNHIIEKANNIVTDIRNRRADDVLHRLARLASAPVHPEMKWGTMHRAPLNPVFANGPRQEGIGFAALQIDSCMSRMYDGPHGPVFHGLICDSAFYTTTATGTMQRLAEHVRKWQHTALPVSKDDPISEESAFLATTDLIAVAHAGWIMEPSDLVH